MHIELRPLSSIIPYENNPRVNDDGVAAVAASIREFGWRTPIVVDTGNVIICGHTRFKAAQQLGLSEVPVHVADGLTPDQVRAYRLADNQTASLSSWDEELLPLELTGLKDAGFDLDVIGFSPEELAKWLAPPDTNGHTDPDDSPDAAATDAEAMSRPGEIYQLGRHRLACGDSTKTEVLTALMAGKKADLLVTDPPYGVRQMYLAAA